MEGNDFPLNSQMESIDVVGSCVLLWPIVGVVCMGVKLTHDYSSTLGVHNS